MRGAKTVETLYRDWLAPLPKTDSEEKLIKRPHERYHWPLALAIVLLAAEILLPERKREPKTKTVNAPSAKTAVHEAVALLFLLAISTAALGSPGSALREYKAGKYDQALKEYEKLIERKADDLRLRFNAGTAAYRNRQFDQAAKQFEEALTSPDLTLQEQAYFNRGNTLFQLGDANPDQAQRKETWTKAIQDYENSLRLNAQDADAKFNYEFVKKRLEELKQQQQQSKNDKSDQKEDENKDQKQQQNQENQDSKKDQDQKSQQQEQNKKEQKQDSGKQNQDKQDQEAQQKKEEEQKKQQAAKKDQQKKDDQEKQHQAKQAKQSKGNPDDKSDDQQQAAAAAAGQMTPEQAQQLLDTQKGEEQMLPSKPNAKPVDTSRPTKDW
jgi:Ca-activated chloride channel family protein